MYYAILTILVIILGFFFFRYFSKYNTSNEKCHKYTQALYDLKNQTVGEHLYQSLCIMDGTYANFRDEECANIELTNCLKILGHDALYPAPRSNGRTADISIDNYAIVEGKLDPNRSEIDRLIGQTLDYLKTPYHIYIIIYGKVGQTQLDRINDDLCDKYPNRIDLIYLTDPMRIRAIYKENSFEYALNDR